MLYAIKDGTNGPQLRSIRFPSDLLNGEVAYDGPIKFKSDGYTLDMKFDKKQGLRPKYDEEVLEDEKQEAIKQAKREYEAILQAGCMTSLGIKMDCDDRSVSLLTSTATMLKQLSPATVMVCDYENQTHEISLEDFTKLALEVGAYVSSVYQQKWARRERILATQSSVELQALIA